MTPKLHRTITSISSLLIALVLASPPVSGADFVWQRSLTFPLGQQGGTPNPVNAQNIVAHKGKLYAGFATVSGGSYGNYQSYIYRKDSAASPWVLDATFPPGTLRVDSLISATFENDEQGNPIPGGPVTKLVAATNKGIAATGSVGVRIFVRDDTTGTWIEQQISNQSAVDYEARNLVLHGDSVTGADMIFVAASPAPCRSFSPPVRVIANTQGVTTRARARPAASSLNISAGLGAMPSRKAVTTSSQ